MYLWITSYCNHSCAHCCNGKQFNGSFMDQKTWEKAVEFANDYGGVVALGGGEPTLHPRFLEVLCHAIAYADEYVWLATNGSQTRVSIMLAKMAESGVIGCALSQDEWHDEIDDEVIEAFERKGFRGDGDNREIRRTIEPLNNGLCDFGKKGCCCEEWQIMTDGRVRQCGCDDSPYIGDIWNGIKPEYEDAHECWLDWGPVEQKLSS